jgi:hypothetical protein
MRNTCDFGPAAYLSVVSTVIWFITAFEMYYNTPMSKQEDRAADPGNVVSSLEISDFGDAGIAYFQRIYDKGDQIPTLNQIQRSNSTPLAERVLELSSKRSPKRSPEAGSYKPPVSEGLLA